MVSVLFACALVFDEARQIVFAALADAYLAVGVFVAATFAIFFFLESRLGTNVGDWLQRYQRFEVPVAALLGAIPGCGGAVMVITQFAMGRASFGAIVAVLTSTMGDAAFFLLAQQFGTGLLLISVSLVLGTISGWLVNLIHSDGYLRVQRPLVYPREQQAVRVPAMVWTLWSAITAPALLLGIAGLFQVEIPPLLYWTLGVGGGLLSIVLWALSPSQAVHLAASEVTRPVPYRVALNTNFVTVWVVTAFLVFEFAGGAESLTPVFNAATPLLPLIGIVVGFLPGCGPQILVTMLYLSGVLPMSAQLGNAISNDGDALFPAIAVAPRAAVIATVYTAIPALLVAYGYYVLFESGG
ncbi:MAG: putative manganese transporter [Pseudomonadota bacterium]